MRPRTDGGVRCSAGFGFCAGMCGSAEPAPASRFRGATTDPHHRAAAHRGPPTTAPRGGEPRQTPTGHTRSTTDPHHRVPRHHQPRPPAPRGGEPRPSRSAPRGARHAGFTHADHTPTTAARAIERPRVAERTAHLHRHHTVSDASQTSGRCQVQRRVRLAYHRGSGRHAERRASAEPVPPMRAGGAPPTPRAVSRHAGDHPPPQLAAVSRARHPRATRGAPPSRPVVSPPASGHAQPHLAATSRARPDWHHAKPDTRGSPTRTTRSPPPHARSSDLWVPNK
ncbi:hypothetical protein GobsT_63910 [Gemmata obscuriglobus]|nr:hypothetical protein GobsT_63910 [Gemmata obscuriglobus]VTS10911.1 unnamed protein product [Gemmata obscuriglobus UQM 2246]